MKRHGRIMSLGWSLVALGMVALASCTLAPDHCLRMSDCGDGTTCVEGLCRADAVTAGNEAGTSSAATTTSTTTSNDASTTVLDAAPVTDATTFDASAPDAGDAGDAGDGAVTDAASDR